MFTPYAHQQRIVDRTEDLIDAGKPALIVLGTGGGKTAIAAMLPQNEPGRVLICCCMVPLIMQFYNDLLMVGIPEDSIGILQGDNSDSQEWLSKCRVVVAMSQTLQSPRGDEFLSANAFDLFIGDERHRGELDIAEDLVNAPSIVGMTATPHRGDGDELMINRFDWIQEITMQQMIDAGMLIDYDHYFYPEDLGEDVFLDPAYVFEQWHSNLLGTPTLGFCKTKEDCQEYSDYFTAQGYPCAVVCDDISDDDFQDARDDLNDGAVHVFWSVTKIATGFNEPIAKGLMICCARKSLSLWVQMIGRIVRKDGTGRRGLLLDFFNNGLRLPDPRDIVDWRDIPQAAGKVCKKCGLKNSTKKYYCGGCGDCLASDREKQELREAVSSPIDLDSYIRLHRPMELRERRSENLDRVGVARTAREIAFWEKNCDPAWATEMQKRHFPDESPITASQVLENSIFADGMSPQDLAAYLTYLRQHADRRQNPSAWIVSQIRAEGGQDAIDMYKLSIDAA
ncbi:MAG: DEAD/DEAH box helicase [Microcoleus sp.]